MARTNTKTSIPQQHTHEGAKAFSHMTDTQALRRSVLSCMLFEDEFYEDGKSISERISELAAKVPVEELASLCVEARSDFNLRHVPLRLLLSLIQLGRGNSTVADTIEKTIQRPDELAELLAMYWKGGRKPLSAQMKKGLARAFAKFNAHSLAKYNQDNAVKLRDVLFMTHSKPKDPDQAEVWKKLVDKSLESPDTWEVALSGGADKRETFERLLKEGKLGYLALLRNLRNMQQSGVDMDLVKNAIEARQNGAHRVLPFRYVAAARACPQAEPALDKALLAAISELPRLTGKTAVLVDVSGSMDTALSGKSDMTRLDAGAALAALVNGDVRMFSFSHEIKEVPPRRGMAGVEAIVKSQPHGGTYLGKALDHIVKYVPYDRLIVITDEQSADDISVSLPKDKKHYLINVASYKNGVGYGDFVHIDGFSESVFKFIQEVEK